MRVFITAFLTATLVLLFILYKLFPLKYYSYVLLYCDDLDPLLVMSVIRTESSFRENAVSPLGAYGLMQVMPQTAEWLNSRFKKNYDYRTVEGNIALGCLYLNYLLEKDGNLEDALIHYNTGPYAQQEIKDDAGKRYVRKVLGSYRIYKLLYRR
ncbi:lytic transglycosylase domain-containing protein [Fervidobacterium thailandense]|uniref:Lytic transglycosylase n=1 Tax=Fervidobacterium thailandense TaxID=1008305 RepID=A0A1E3G4S3_9BACT|nr:lytic transglycosylase domain-containing protein [Fervidobacterium thailandense]ODN31130.1 lytic transglycosylase [Fervidobacterium thailandense]